MTLKTMAAMALAGCVLAGMTGCASTRQVQRDKPVSAAALEEAKYQVDTTRRTNALLYRLAIAAADMCMATDASHRAPFSLLFNGANTSEELRTGIYQVSGVAELPAIQAHAPDLQAFDGARVVMVNRQSTDNINKVYSRLRDAFENNESLELTLDDNRSVTTKPVPACPSFVVVDYSGRLKEAFNNFNGYEAIPRYWLTLARTEDERAFILARSLYFTGAEGEAKLRHAFYGGAAVSGVLRGLTLGLGNLIVEPRTIAVQLRRNGERSDADLFGLNAMRRAGFDPQAALQFAQRSIVEGGTWPSEADELRFDADRLAALRRSLQ